MGAAGTKIGHGDRPLIGSESTRQPAHPEALQHTVREGDNFVWRHTPSPISSNRSTSDLEHV
eukprot:scaffold6465_cov56-Isochrysis_galbana.AAC.2